MAKKEAVHRYVGDRTLHFFHKAKPSPEFIVSRENRGSFFPLKARHQGGFDEAAVMNFIFSECLLRPCPA